jgi:hypothetical protein
VQSFVVGAAVSKRNAAYNGHVVAVYLAAGAGEDGVSAGYLYDVRWESELPEHGLPANLLVAGPVAGARRVRQKAFRYVD